MQPTERRDQFHEEHGPYIKTPEGSYLFIDGAEDENSLCGYGLLSPPPEDEFELATKICRYWELISKKYEERLRDVKSYLSGSGFQPQALYEAYTDEEKLEVLKECQRKARNTRSKYLAAKRKVKRKMPKWMADAERQDAENAQRLDNFRSEIEKIEL